MTMSSMPADGEAAAAPQRTAVTAPKPATTKPATPRFPIKLRFGPGISKEEFTPAWVKQESGLFPLTEDYQMHDHHGRNVRLSYVRGMNVILIDRITEAESSTHPTPTLPQPTTGVSALSLGLSIKFCFSFPRLITRDRPTTPQTLSSMGLAQAALPPQLQAVRIYRTLTSKMPSCPHPQQPSPPTKRKINLRYGHDIDQAIYNPSWVQKESGIYPLGDEDNLVEVDSVNGCLEISYQAATRSIFLSTVREDSDSSDSDSDECVVSPAPPKQLAAGYSFQSDSSSSKKRSRNEGHVDFEDQAFIANRPNRASPTLGQRLFSPVVQQTTTVSGYGVTQPPPPTLGEGVSNPVVHQTTAPVPTTSDYGAAQALQILGSGNWELPVPRTVSPETLLEMEQSLLAWLAVVRQMRSNLLQQNNPHNPQNPQ
ncbi:hypothetical protein V8F06_013933 [Rhypophila decipiens]